VLPIRPGSRPTCTKDHRVITAAGTSTYRTPSISTSLTFSLSPQLVDVLRRHLPLEGVGEQVAAGADDLDVSQLGVLLHRLDGGGDGRLRHLHQAEARVTEMAFARARPSLSSTLAK